MLQGKHSIILSTLIKLPSLFCLFLSGHFTQLLLYVIVAEATTEAGGLNAFYWYQIFALDSAVVEVQEMFSSHGGHLTNAMYHHGETL